MQNTFYDRLLQIMSYLKVDSFRGFAKKIDISYSKFQSYQRGSQPGIDVLDKIISINPEVNAEWLVTGKGKMLKESDINSDDDIDILTEVISNQKQEISDLKAQIREKDKQLGELIKTNLMLLEREKSIQTHEKGSSGSLAG